MAKLDLNGAFTDVDFKRSEEMLGKGSMMPFNSSNSGSRKIMFGTHLEQRLPLCNPDIAYIQTGYEKEFGTYSSSFTLSDSDYEIAAKIAKFSNNPSHHYFLIAVNHDKKKITVFEKKRYKHITENYGYIYSEESAINRAEPGSTISKGSVLMKSNSFDAYNNRMDGKNLLTMYTACEETMEDAIVISESASKALSSPLIKKVTIVINDNDIPLNIYGDRDVYKIFPDIGEETQHGILCGMRVEKKEECLFSLSLDRLREILISDERYTVSGKVVDIDVYANSPENLMQSPYCGQIRHYYEDNLRMCREIVETIDVGLKDLLDNGYTLDYDLQKLYSKSKGILSNKQFYSAGKVYSNLVLEITLIDEIPVLRGDKLTNRYGGKGITARIRPDNMMPKTDSGQSIDVLLNMCGVYGRENAGQLFELSASYICIKIVEYFRTQVLDVGECITMLLDLFKIVAPELYEYTDNMLDSLDDESRIAYINCITNDESIYLAIEPMSENMTIDKLDLLYEKFPWIKMHNVLTPIEDSNGNIRYTNSRRPVLYGYQYIYRLKQYAEEKFSVTSLSSTNIRNENTRNKASNNYKALYARTPIRFGEMEIGNLVHMGADIVSQLLMLYSSSPHARRLCSELLTGDPFNIDVKLDMESTNRNAEILNVYLKTKGLRLVFKKSLKVKDYGLIVYPMEFDIPIEGLDIPIEPMIFYDRNEKLDPEACAKRLIESKNAPISPMIFSAMAFDDVDGVNETIETIKKNAVEI